VSFARKVSFLVYAAVIGVLLPAQAQETPPTFEEATPTAAGSATPLFRMSYPVRDAASGQTFTEQRNTAATDVPTAVSESDIAAGLAMPDPGPPPSTTVANNAGNTLQNDEAAFQAVGEAGNAPLQEIDIGEGRFTGFPLRFTVGIQEGYNSDVYVQPDDPAQSALPCLYVAIHYEFGSPRLTLTTGLNGNLSYSFAALNQNRLTNIH